VLRIAQDEQEDRHLKQVLLASNLDQLVTPRLESSLNEIQPYLIFLAREVRLEVLHCLWNVNPWSLVDDVSPRELEVEVKVVDLHHAEAGARVVWSCPIVPGVDLLEVIAELRLVVDTMYHSRL